MVSTFIFKTAALAATLLASANARLEKKHPHGSTAEMFLFGAQVKSFHAAMDPKLDILFMSNESFMDGVQPIRGGIPVVFPNFGAAEGSPSHGFARITNWTLTSHVKDANKKSPSVATFTMASSSSTRAMWPVDFKLEHEVKLYANQLETALHVHNKFTKPIEFHALLHNYFWVDDVTNKGVQISGLKDVKYFDKVDKTNKTEHRAHIDFSAQTDNVCMDAPDVVTAI
ncbi:unnamed protein product [Peronospora belbahrii]|uniref:Glucose-6-phosphate 1-epimerase n=1 Tax=Peronospora belbahrii TaxID=622444 RepID=A0AAU9L545_9STRA|nr:unnamed protein product [Peronospora belbahrii]CAH0513910.1 unnamed protein product [Peronospora belbahrii]